MKIGVRARFLRKAGSFRERLGIRALTPIFLVLAGTAFAQTEEARTLAIDGGASIAYTLRRHPPEATSAVDAKVLAPKSALDTATYAKGIKVSDAEMKTLDIQGDKFHPEWNYTIRPRSAANRSS